MSLFDIATASMCNNEISLEVTYSHSSPVSPPPFMAACAEIEQTRKQVLSSYWITPPVWIVERL